VSLLRRRRRREPARTGPVRLALRLERDRFVAGETVRGSAVVVEGGGRGEIRVWLSFRERSGEYEAVTITLPGGALQDDLGPGAAHGFAIELPGDAPPSYISRHGALWWTVDASVGEPATGDPVRRRIEVGRPRIAAA
jgi:hypothetical protein